MLRTPLGLRGTLRSACRTHTRATRVRIPWSPSLPQSLQTLQTARCFSEGLPAALPAANPAPVHAPQSSNSGSAPRSLEEAIAALRQWKGRGAPEPEELEQCLALAEGAPLERLADLAECFGELKLRLPLRNVITLATDRLAASSGSPGPEALSSVVRLLGASGRGTLFCGELFEFCNQHVAALEPADMAGYLYEAGRHGLRCRHYIDGAVERAAQLVPQMSIEDIMRTAQGLTRFSRDWRAFYVAALPKIQPQLKALSTTQTLIALRIARDLQSLPGFVDLHAQCCTVLMLKVETLTLAEGALCLRLSEHSARYRPQAQGLVRSVEQTWNQMELAGLQVVEVVDALNSFASWSMRPRELVHRLSDILVENLNELKYTGNVSLWITATQAFATMDMQNVSWPPRALSLARDRHFVERVSFFQQSHLICALARLRLFDEHVYNNIADLLLSDTELFKEINDLSRVLWSFALANYCHPKLFDMAFDKIIDWFDAEQLDVTKRVTQGALLQAVWSFTVAGYHKHYESFAAFLDYTFFAELQDTRAMALKRQAQIADAALHESPEIAALSQYSDEMRAFLADSKVRQHVSSNPACNTRLLKKVEGLLDEMGWVYDTFVMPNEASSACVHLSLERQLGKKLGIVMASRFDTFSVGLPEEGRPPRESGLLALLRSILAKHGWQVEVIFASEWEALGGIEEQRAFLQALAKTPQEDKAGVEQCRP
mmetsp:Transcript_33198/g.72423  ORF Transcript_33198/g.72423 Transcript_33198/m.72423 type:complete len:718 (+) Transcript_33198:57-2210(+)